VDFDKPHGREILPASPFSSKVRHVPLILTHCQSASRTISTRRFSSATQRPVCLSAWQYECQGGCDRPLTSVFNEIVRSFLFNLFLRHP
jgi:hypothetical protein